MIRHVILAVDQGAAGTTCPRRRRRPRCARPRRRCRRGRDAAAGLGRADPRRSCGGGSEAAAVAALADAGVAPAAEVGSIGIANQRETTVVWERRSGRPVAPAMISSGAQRTAERCRELPAKAICARTGLTPDPYVSAAKLEWILRRNGSRCRRPRLRDGQLVAPLAAQRRRRARDRRLDASRTMLLGLAISPGTTTSSRSSGSTGSSCRRCGPRRASTPRARSARCRRPSPRSRATSRRRSSVTAASHPARRRRRSKRRARSCRGKRRRLLPAAAQAGAGTAAATVAGGPASYALEGSIFVAGAALQSGLRDQARHPRRRRRQRGAGPVGSLERRGRLHTGADRARLAALGAGRARARQRHHARHPARASRPGRARVDRLPDARRRGRAAAPARVRCASTAAPRRTDSSSSCSRTCCASRSRSPPNGRRRRSERPRSRGSRPDAGARPSSSRGAGPRRGASRPSTRPRSSASSPAGATRSPARCSRTSCFGVAEPAARRRPPRRRRAGGGRRRGAAAPRRA